jgi:hypothetical protein
VGCGVLSPEPPPIRPFLLLKGAFLTRAGPKATA